MSCSTVEKFYIVNGLNPGVSVVCLCDRPGQCTVVLLGTVCENEKPTVLFTTTITRTIKLAKLLKNPRQFNS